MNDQWLIAQALAFSAEHGVPVFPCKQDKSPTTPRGFYDATEDPETIQNLFSHPEAAFVAMPTGEVTGIAVLDIDIKKSEDRASGFDWLNSNGHLVPETRQVLSQSGGRHFFFGQVHGLRSSQDKIAEGVDVRAEGGLIIVAGLGYELIKHMPFTELPRFPNEIIAQLESESAKESYTASRKHDLSQIYKPRSWHEPVRDWVGALVNGSNNRQRLLELAPLLTTTGYTVEQTEGELAAFYDGAVQKGFGPDTSNEYKSQQFELKNFEQLLELEDPKFIVEDMLLDNSFAMVFGATGSFKSTVVLDMCVCIQHQLPWQGKKTEQRNVAFFSHEDGSGFKKRFLAATSRYSITDPVIYWDDKVPNLIDQKGLTSYIEELKSKEIGLVVIDTFAYSIAGAEENSSKEMGLAVESIKLLSDSIDGTVLIVHHTGKNADRGARGSSVIKAATDSEFKIESDESEIEVASTKQRHCEQAPPMFLKSEVVPVGNATACVIKKSAASPFKRGDYGLRGKSLIAWQVLENLFLEKDDTCDIETYVASLKRSNLFTKGQNHHGSFKKALDRAIKDFQFRNLIDLKDDVICLSEEGLAAIEALRAWKGFNMPHIDEKESEEGF